MAMKRKYGEYFDPQEDMMPQSEVESFILDTNASTEEEIGNVIRTAYMLYGNWDYYSFPEDIVKIHTGKFLKKRKSLTFR